jgi:hypothetical protein
MRTNPAYAYLAYRRAIIQQQIHYLQSQYTSVDGTEPKDRMICEEVFQSDAEVPEREIIQFIEELQEKDAHLGLEMNKFEFTKREEQEIHDDGTGSGTGIPPKPPPKKGGGFKKAQ